MVEAKLFGPLSQCIGNLFLIILACSVLYMIEADLCLSHWCYVLKNLTSSDNFKMMLLLGLLCPCDAKLFAIYEDGLD